MSRRVLSRLVADNGLVPSLNRSLNSWSKARKSESSSGVRQLLGEERSGKKFPSSRLLDFGALSGKNWGPIGV